MLSRKITFVLGAGASVELGFPLGSELQRKVRDIAEHEIPSAQTDAGAQVWDPTITPICCAMKDLGYRPADAMRSLERLVGGVTEAPSIDTFLHNNKHDKAVVDCGKLAITHAVLIAERDCPVFWEANAHRHFRGIDMTPEDLWWSQSGIVRKSYVSPIWDELCQDHSSEDIERIFENIAVVNFNYDRSLEEALAFKLRSNFGLHDEAARRIVDTLQIVRPYGSPHGDSAYSAARIPFDRRSSTPLRASAENIRTFTEAVNDDVRDSIKSLMDSSAAVVFLGFGFHRQNVELFTGSGDHAPRAYFSFFGGSQENADHIAATLKGRIGRIARGQYHTTATYGYHVGTSIETLRHFQFPIFRSA